MIGVAVKGWGRSDGQLRAILYLMSLISIEPHVQKYTVVLDRKAC